MTALYLGADVGDNLPKDLTKGTSTTSKPIELVIPDVAATGLTKLQVLRALEAFEHAITTDTWPPA